MTPPQITRNLEDCTGQIIEMMDLTSSTPLTLGGMTKELSSTASLSQIYTKHSIKATAITLWSDAG